MMTVFVYDDNMMTNSIKYVKYGYGSIPIDTFLVG